MRRNRQLETNSEGFAPPAAGAISEYLRSRRPAMVRLLEKLVRCESPTEAKAAVDRLGRILAGEWRKRGARVRLIGRKRVGDHLRVEWPAGRRGRAGQILVLGHMDTVHPLGTLRERPFRLAGGRARGPGALDMKGGLVIALFATEALAAIKRQPGKRVVFLWTSDEETGSGSSRRLIEREARQSSAVLVLEPGGEPEGALKTSRKGAGRIELTATGRAAHAGWNPQEGVNAVQEIALQTARLAAWSDAARGITVSPTMVAGGTRSNVIPAQARVVADVRARRISDMRRLERRLRGLRPILPGARLRISGGFSRPPLERRASAALFQQARKCARALGISLREVSAGGGSDGNFTAALGIPTLDGLGAVGAAPHSPDENIVVDKLPERAALLAALLATL